MSVYTKVEASELSVFLRRYSLGDLVSHSGIEAGMTNTNYWLKTDQGCYVLTLFEHLDSSDLDYVLGLQHHLNTKGVACASPIADNQGLLSSILHGRPAAIISRVAGSVYDNPSVDQCCQIGQALARFHQAGVDFKYRKLNSRGLKWWISTAIRLRFVLTESDFDLINQVIKTFQTFDLTELPQGALHGDLFHDNALFDGHCLGGIIDFDYACHDYFVYDIAITINDWCIDKDGALVTDKMDALLSAYGNIKSLLDCEHAALPIMLQVAALRFWLSRLYHKTFPLKGELTFVKDPNDFRQMLLLRRE